MTISSTTCTNNADNTRSQKTFTIQHHDASHVGQVAARISPKMTETDIHEPHDGPVIIAKGLFSHTGGQSSRLFNAAIVLAVLGLSIVALRIWISKRVINRWHLDDSQWAHNPHRCID